MIDKQRGSTLLVALVMLVLLTLIALSAMSSTTTSIQTVGNAQFREEANAIAQQAIEGVISNNFTVSPAASSVAADINGDGTTDYTAQVAVPTCKNSVPLTNADLNSDNPLDAVCLRSSSLQNTGIVGASGVLSSAQSWCYLQTWEVNATVNDGNTGANTSVSQGVSIRVPAGTTCS